MYLPSLGGAEKSQQHNYLVKIYCMLKEPLWQKGSTYICIRIDPLKKAGSGGSVKRKHLKSCMNFSVQMREHICFTVNFVYEKSQRVESARIRKTIRSFRPEWVKTGPRPDNSKVQTCRPLSKIAQNVLNMLHYKRNPKNNPHTI